MTREEKLDWLCRLRADFNNGIIFTPWNKEFTEALTGVLEQELMWIPVSERLPEAGEYVGDVAKYYLVQNEYEDMLVARYTHSEYWEQMYQQKPIAYKIVAWMPLPQPYKAESED